MDHLANTLRALASSKEVNLLAVAKALERHANEGASTSVQSDEPKSYKDLVSKYHQAQISSKESCRDSKGLGRSTGSTSKYYSLNFAKFRQQLKGLRKTTTNIQVVGFTDADTYEEVLDKGTKGLGVKCEKSLLALICSNGIIPNAPIHDLPWTLGEYVKYNGGTQNRSKKVWGVLVPDDDDEKNPPSTYDSGISKTSTDRKRFISSSSDASQKKFKPSVIGTSKNMPVVLSDDADTDPLEIEAANMTGKYCPINGGLICTSVYGFGLIGVWRMLHLEFSKCDEEVYHDLIQDTKICQPENCGYYLYELMEGSKTLFRVSPSAESVIHQNNLHINSNVTRITRTSKCQVLDTFNMFATLLLLGPDHGRVTYKWERRNEIAGVWDSIDVPPHTCLLYVDLPGDYKCQMGGRSFYFTILCRESQSDDLCVDMKDFKFGAVVGRGSFATVHRGTWKGIDHEVALKRIRMPCGSSAATTNLPKEISILRNLKHPNIVELLAYARSEEEIVLVTNFVDGSNLDKILFGNKPQELSEQQARDIAIKITDAVHYMHSQDPIVIHQDLKPQNVLVTSDLEGVYVCDMGIAKVKRITETTVTSVSKGPGTYPYMAPEMFRKGHRGPPVDIYSLGCLLIELFGRRRVWPGLDGPDIMVQIMGTYDTPPQTPNTSHLKAPFGMICQQLCQLDAARRPKSGEVLKMLKEATEK